MWVWPPIDAYAMAVARQTTHPDIGVYSIFLHSLSTLCRLLVGSMRLEMLDDAVFTTAWRSGGTMAADGGERAVTYALDEGT